MCRPLLYIHQIACIPFSFRSAIESYNSIKLNVYNLLKLGYFCTYIFTTQGGDRVSMYFSRHHALLNLHQTRRSSVCMDGQTYSILSSERSQLFCLAGYESSRIQHVLRRDSALRHFTWCSSRSSPMVDIH